MIGLGSEKPAEVKGQARLYSMKYCPFSHRVRLVLALKQIPHDVVNIKPEDQARMVFRSMDRVVINLILY